MEKYSNNKKLNGVLNEIREDLLSIHDTEDESRKSEKCVWLISLGKVSYARDQYGQEGKCMPNLAERGTKEKMHRITKGGYVRIDSYTTGKKWDGRPVEYYGD